MQAPVGKTTALPLRLPPIRTSPGSVAVKLSSAALLHTGVEGAAAIAPRGHTVSLLQSGTGSRVQRRSGFRPRPGAWKPKDHARVHAATEAGIRTRTLPDSKHRMDRPRVSLRGLRPPFRGRNVTSAMRWPRPCVLPAIDGPCVALSRDGSAGEGRDGGRRGTAGLAGDGRVPPGPPLRPFRSRLGKTEPAKKRGAFPSASRPANQGEEAGLGQSPGQDQRPGIARCPRGSLQLGRRWPQGAGLKYYTTFGGRGAPSPTPVVPG